jgi:hypothetical protein
MVHTRSGNCYGDDAILIHTDYIMTNFELHPGCIEWAVDSGYAYNVPNKVWIHADELPICVNRGAFEDLKELPGSLVDFAQTDEELYACWKDVSGYYTGQSDDESDSDSEDEDEYGCVSEIDEELFVSQKTIWKSYYTNIVLTEFSNTSLRYDVRWYTDLGTPVNQRWCLRWHNFIPFQSTVSGQLQIHLEYDGWEAEYGESGSDSDSDNDSDSEDEDEYGCVSEIDDELFVSQFFTLMVLDGIPNCEYEV